MASINTRQYTRRRTSTLCQENWILYFPQIQALEVPVLAMLHLCRPFRDANDRTSLGMNTKIKVKPIRCWNFRWALGTSQHLLQHRKAQFTTVTAGLLWRPVAVRRAQNHSTRKNSARKIECSEVLKPCNRIYIPRLLDRTFLIPQ